MLYDLEKQESRTIHADVCIIGAGAAGITMALNFEKLGVKTVLLEGGGLSFPDKESLDLYDAKLGEKSYPVAASRLRYFGGSTNHWGGWSRELDDFDFTDKPYFEVPGWPISKSELDDYYSRAAEICEIPNYKQYHSGYLEQHVKDGVLPWDKSSFNNKFFIFSPPTRFGQVYLEAIKISQFVDTYLNANAYKLISNGHNIQGVEARSLNGHSLVVNAKKTILAMGGLENPRFLLNNSNSAFPNGVGNQNDWVGRCFMDHPGFQPINLLLPQKLLYKRHQFEQSPIMPVMSMTKEALLKDQLNNFCLSLTRTKGDKKWPSNYGNNPWFADQGSGYGQYRAQFIFEPSPCKESRVTLSDEKDILGQRKLKLDWRFNERDFRSLETVVEKLIKELGVRGLGRVQWHKHFEPKTIAAIGGGMHHAGATRMAESAEQGVVDKNCRVFGCEGLYVAGNSVFSHVGFSNPTLTIVALALRLSEHIKGALK